jgi:hypothetical protein
VGVVGEPKETAAGQREYITTARVVNAKELEPAITA